MTVLFVILVLLLLPLLAGASYYGLAVFKLAFFFDLIILIYSIIEILYLRSHLRVGKVEHSREINRGEMADFFLSIALKSDFLPAELTIKAWYGLSDRSLEPTQQILQRNILPYKSGGKEEIIVSLRARHCGWLEVDEIQIVMRGLFGILKSKYNFSADEDSLRTLVLPLTEQTSTYAVQAMRETKEGNLDKKRVEDRSEEVDTLREYNPGDDSRRIHWQVSARLQSIMVKQYEEALEMRTCVMLDDHSYYDKIQTSWEFERALNRRDVVLDTTAGILREFLANELYVRLESGLGRDVNKYTNKIEDLHSMRRQLALLPIDSTPELGTMIESEMKQNVADRYILLSTRLSFESVLAILKLKELTTYISVLYFTEDALSVEMENAIERMRKNGIDVMICPFVISD